MQLRLDDRLRFRTLNHVPLVELESADGNGGHREVVPGRGQRVGGHPPFEAERAVLVGRIVEDLNGGQELEVGHASDDGWQSGDYSHSWRKKHSKSVLKYKIC